VEKSLSASKTHSQISSLNVKSLHYGGVCPTLGIIGPFEFSCEFQNCGVTMTASTGISVGVEFILNLKVFYTFALRLQLMFNDRVNLAVKVRFLL